MPYEKPTVRDEEEEGEGSSTTVTSPSIHTSEDSEVDDGASSAAEETTVQPSNSTLVQNLRTMMKVVEQTRLINEELLREVGAYKQKVQVLEKMNKALESQLLTASIQNFTRSTNAALETLNAADSFNSWFPFSRTSSVNTLTAQINDLKRQLINAKTEIETLKADQATSLPHGSSSNASGRPRIHGAFATSRRTVGHGYVGVGHTGSSIGLNSSGDSKAAAKASATADTATIEDLQEKNRSLEKQFFELELKNDRLHEDNRSLRTSSSTGSTSGSQASTSPGASASYDVVGVIHNAGTGQTQCTSGLERRF